MNDDKYITEAHLFKANNKSHTHRRTQSYKTPFQMHHMVKVTHCYSLPPFCSVIFLCFQWPDEARSYQPTSKLTSEIALPITFLHHCVFWKTNCIFFIIIMHCAPPIWFESVKLNMECDCHRDCFNFSLLDTWVKANAMPETFMPCSITKPTDTNNLLQYASYYSTLTKPHSKIFRLGAFALEFII